MRGTDDYLQVAEVEKRLAMLPIPGVSASVEQLRSTANKVREQKSILLGVPTETARDLISECDRRIRLCEELIDNKGARSQPKKSSLRISNKNPKSPVATKTFVSFDSAPGPPVSLGSQSILDMNRSERLFPEQETDHFPSTFSPSVSSPSANNTFDSGSLKVKKPRKSIFKKKNDKTISDKHPFFELTHDMMVGIRTVVGRTQAKPSHQLFRHHFTDVTRLSFPPNPPAYAQTPPHKMKHFSFKDYAPEVFRRIRKRFGIDPVTYTNVVCGNYEYLEFVSNSKSGEFFFFSYDEQFMIKTISHPEAILLRNLLPAYYHHIKKYPDTLLTRFYGLHKVKVKGMAKRQVTKIIVIPPLPCFRFQIAQERWTPIHGFSGVLPDHELCFLHHFADSHEIRFERIFQRKKVRA